MSTEVFDMTKTSAKSVFIIIIINNKKNTTITCIKAFDTKMCLLHVVLHVICGQGTELSFKLKKELIQLLGKMAEMLSSK